MVCESCSLKSLMLEGFAQNLRNIPPKRCQRTAVCYAKDVRGFVHFLCGRSRNAHRPATGSEATGSGADHCLRIVPLLNEATEADFKAWIEKLQGDGLKNTTITRKVTALKTFFKRMVKAGQVSPRQFEIEVQLEPDTEARIPCTAEQLSAMEKALSGRLALLSVEGPEAKARQLIARDMALLFLLFYSGARIEELLGLRVQNVSWSGGPWTLNLRRKGRSVPLVLEDPAVKALVALMNELRAVDGPPEQLLFVNKHGEDLSSRSVRRRMEAHALKAGLDEAAFSPSALRAGGVIWRLRRHRPIEDIAKAFGVRESQIRLVGDRAAAVA